MTTPSTNFNLAIATTSENVLLGTHLMSNFTTLDSVLGICHTGTGQHKAGLALTSPTLISPVVSGTITAPTIVASTGFFNSMTATAGIITLTSATISTLTIGTQLAPGTIGSSGQVLKASANNIIWASQGTGVSAALDNLASVAINTNLNTFSAGLVTVANIVATSGNITGLTVFQATTGTFAGNLTITGTASMTKLITTSLETTAFNIGTYALPTTVGALNTVLSGSAGTASWKPIALTGAQFYAHCSNTGNYTIGAPSGSSYNVAVDIEDYDTASIFVPASPADSTASYYPVTITASGNYVMGGSVMVAANIAGQNNGYLLIDKSAGPVSYAMGGYAFGTSNRVAGSVLVNAVSGDKFGLRIALNYVNSSGNNAAILIGSTGTSYFYGYKIPDG